MPVLRLRETHNALQLPVFCSSSSFFSASFIENTGEFGAKNYFTGHRTVNTMHGFRNSFQALKTDSCF